MNSFGSVTYSLLLTVIYVGVLYIHPSTRPSTTVSRNDDAVIRSRVTAILISSAVSAWLTSWILIPRNEYTFERALETLGIWPVPRVWELFRSSLLITGILFVGPLVEKLILSSGWRYLKKDLKDGLTGWIGVRNYIVGPLTEELLFRVCIVNLELESGTSPMTAIFVSPLYFATAHIHHAYEVYIAQPDALKYALISSLFQFGFTTVFGWYATFIFLRTGSLWQPFVVHAFCNSMGVPKLGARLEGPMINTYLYNSLLVIGALCFGLLLYPLTQTRNSII